MLSVVANRWTAFSASNWVPTTIWPSLRPTRTDRASASCAAPQPTGSRAQPARTRRPQLQPARGVASVGGHDVSLTLSEGRILEALLAQAGEPIDKQALAQHALGRKLTLYDRSLDMHVSNLRRKLGPHADGSPRIVALRSRGYLYSA